MSGLLTLRLGSRWCKKLGGNLAPCTSHAQYPAQPLPHSLWL